MAFLARIRFALAFFASLALLLSTAACGNKIGDSCTISTDCATEGGRICDSSSPGGYCTVANCDIGTCPSESTCVQFYSVINVDKQCTKAEDCTIDEVCTVGGFCAARDSELRFCMLKCSDQGDCRDKYECRDAARMGAHGGQPVTEEGQSSTTDLQPFCAPALPCTSDMQCDLGDHCSSEGRCTH
jgi:hypothetical protein